MAAEYLSDGDGPASERVEHGGKPRSPLDSTLDVIRSKRRRLVLSKLSDTGDDPLTVSELADYVRAAESSSDAPADGDGADDGVEIALHRIHLPKLAAAGLVDYDPTADIVRPRTHPGSSVPGSGGSTWRVRECEKCGGPREHDAVITIEERSKRPDVQTENEKFSRRPMLRYRCVYCGATTGE